MAFKMKGSAFKLGNVATKSALKQASPIKHETQYSENPNVGERLNKQWVDNHNKTLGTPEHHDYKEPEREKEMEGKTKVVEGGMRKGAEIGGALPMKSPMKDTQSWGIDQRTGGWDSDWAEKDTHNKKHKSGAWNKDHKTKKEVEHEKEGGGKGMDKELGLDRKEEMEGPKMKSPLEHKATPGEKSKNLETYKTPSGEQKYGSAEAHNTTYGTDRHHDAKSKERKLKSETKGKTALSMKSPLEQTIVARDKNISNEEYDKKVGEMTRAKAKGGGGDLSERKKNKIRKQAARLRKKELKKEEKRLTPKRKIKLPKITINLKGGGRDTKGQKFLGGGF